MLRVLSVKDQAVTRGVLDKDVAHYPDHIELTFTDVDGTPHTIFPHRDGPFADPEAAIEAWTNGTFHGEPDDKDPPDEPHPPAGPVLGQQG